MSRFPDETLRELRQITDELATATEDDPRRPDLLERREELRRLARAGHLAMTDPAGLQRELDHLRKRLSALERERVQIPKWQKQAGGYLTDPEAAGRDINRKLDKINAPERAVLEQRIAEIESALGGDSRP
jgi:hypothetical protein